MATITKRGMASLTGIVGAFDVVIYPVTQEATGTHSFEVEKVKDNQGQTAAMISREETEAIDVKFKLLGDTAAHAKVGAALLAPFAVVTISGCDYSDWNGKWTHMPGSNRTAKNDATGDLSIKLERWVDSSQNTLLTTTPA